MPQCTLKAALIDRLHEQESDRETRFIAAQEAGRTRTEAVNLIARAYDFSRDDDNCLFSPTGKPLQMAMKLTRRACPLETLTVICKQDGDDLFWFVTNMSRAPFEAGAYIAAVQARIEKTRIEKNQGGRN